MLTASIASFGESGSDRADISWQRCRIYYREAQNGFIDCTRFCILLSLWLYECAIDPASPHDEIYMCYSR